MDQFAGDPTRAGRSVAHHRRRLTGRTASTGSFRARGADPRASIGRRDRRRWHPGEPAQLERLAIEFALYRGIGGEQHLETAIESVAVPLERADAAADRVAALEQRDVDAAAGEVTGGDETGEPTTDDEDVRGEGIVAARAGATKVADLPTLPDGGAHEVPSLRVDPTADEPRDDAVEVAGPHSATSSAPNAL